MDVAITGQGFFQIETADGGIAYTRAGNLTTNADGVLVNAQGMPLIPQIELPTGSKQLHIGKDGTVTATVGEKLNPLKLGKSPW